MTDENGWSYLAAVSDALRQDGINSSPQELRIVASAIDEVRFEVVEDKVRALYGHSRPVSISYERANLDGELYHGTASPNLNNILQAGTGSYSV